MFKNQATASLLVLSAILGLCMGATQPDTLPVGSCTSTSYTVKKGTVEECVVEEDDPESCSIYTFNWDSLTTTQIKDLNNFRCAKLGDPDYGTKVSHDSSTNDWNACYEICLETESCNAVYIPDPSYVNPDQCGLYQCVGPYTDYTGTEITIRGSGRAGHRLFWFRNKPQCLTDKEERSNSQAPTSAPTNAPTYLSGRETGTLATYFDSALNEMSLGTSNLISILSLGSLIECASACIGSSVASCKAFTFDANELTCSLHSAYDSTKLVSATSTVVYKMTETDTGTDGGSSSSSSSGTSGGVVAGISIGVLVAVIGAVALIWYVVSRRNYAGSSSTTTTTKSMPSTQVVPHESSTSQFNSSMGVI